MRAYRDQYASLFRNGRDIALIAVSVDTPQEQFEWARDDEFPFLFVSDPGAEVGQMYGAFRERSDGSFMDNRTLFIIDESGKIAWRAAPFREIDPTAYEELGAALSQIVPAPEED